MGSGGEAVQSQGGEVRDSSQGSLHSSQSLAGAIYRCGRCVVICVVCQCDTMRSAGATVEEDGLIIGTSGGGLLYVCMLHVSFQ